MAYPKLAYPKPPDLQALVIKHGGYSGIPPEAWAAFDQAMRQWHADRRIATAGEVIEPKKSGDLALKARR